MDLLTAALSYAARGWPIIPLWWCPKPGLCACRKPDCEHPGKHPLGKRDAAPRGLKSAATDLATIHQWWTNYPLANIGVLTGSASGVVVLDIDPRHGGDENLRTLEQQHGALPVTVEVVTGGGGRHVYFRCPNGGVRSYTIAQGVELKGDGSYIVVPPSIHKSGHPYEWEVTRHIDDVEIAELPPWLLPPASAGGPTGAGYTIFARGPIPEGSRNATLTSLAGLLRRAGLDTATIAAVLHGVNLQRCNPPLDAQEVDRIAQSVGRYTPHHTANGQVTTLRLTTPVTLRLDTVQPERPQWLWPGRIPLGKVTILDGDPGLGKSLLALDIAARVSRGAPMPDGSRGDLIGPAGVVLLAVEDDPADTIRPRLDAAGADTRRIVLLSAVREIDARTDGTTSEQIRLPDLSDVDAIRDAITSIGARLLIVDPVMAYLSGVDSHVDAEVRRVLVQLAELARETGVACVVIRHLSKGGGSNPIYRGGGSIAFVAVARSGLLVAADPDDPEGKRRVLAPTKSNLAEHPPSLAFRVINDPLDWAPRLEWEGPVALTARQLLAQPEDSEERTRVEDARAFLEALLAEGPVDARDVLKQAKAAGIAERTLYRAKAALAVRSERKPNTRAEWRWVLTRRQHSEAGDSRDCQDCQGLFLGNLGNLDHFWQSRLDEPSTFAPGAEDPPPANREADHLPEGLDVGAVVECPDGTQETVSTVRKSRVDGQWWVEFASRKGFVPAAGLRVVYPAPGGVCRACGAPAGDGWGHCSRCLGYEPAED